MSPCDGKPPPTSHSNNKPRTLEGHPKYLNIKSGNMLLAGFCL